MLNCKHKEMINEHNHIFKTFYEKRVIILHFCMSLMSGLIKGSQTLYLLLPSVCFSILFWLKHMKKILPHTDMYLGKGGLF